MLLILAPLYIGSGYAANEMDDKEDMLLIQW